MQAEHSSPSNSDIDHCTYRVREVRTTEELETVLNLNAAEGFEGWLVFDRLDHFVVVMHDDVEEDDEDADDEVQLD